MQSYLSRPEIPILSGFYLTVPAKKSVALVGRNGSGKSSIIPLMERFYDPTLGEVLLDGENIKNLKLEWLRSRIGLVTQEPALLSLSIRDNIAFGRDAEVLVLSNFTLKVNGGQTVAVVGVSGSGKSTIISLIERFYDLVAGQVLLDGRDLKSYNLRWLRNHLGLVQQEPIIFSTTIRENIIYARHNASEAEMKEAARIANAHHFISSLPHGYDTHVGMRGVDLTPGQKQRIAIARVVLKNAPILLLDEASSSIESESSRVIQEALDTLIMGNKTTILIAHRAAMMRHVDNIVVLNGGRIVEEGTHDTLMSKNGLYVRLMQPHFGKGLRQHRLV
ncbi:hypothetical protein KY285_019650 [Solanum tuberosum]|nr:hypothetical protein KY285_019650 [Solanum tuberosum]